MLLVTLDFVGPLETPKVCAAVELCASQFGLERGLEQHKAEQSHWHLRQPHKSGTLEVSFLVAPNQIHVVVHQNRAGVDQWALKVAPGFARALGNMLGARYKPILKTNGNGSHH